MLKIFMVKTAIIKLNLVFKALARSLREALELDKRVKNILPSTKENFKKKMKIFPAIDIRGGSVFGF